LAQAVFTVPFQTRDVYPAAEGARTHRSPGQMAISNAEGMSFDVESAIRSFVADESCTTLELPASLSVEQRRCAKKCAEQHEGVRCESFGFGAERRLHLFKQPSPKAEGVSGNAELHVDEIQQAVRVKNTFIDDWVGGQTSSEPVQFRSLPISLLRRTLERCLQEVGDGKLSLAGSLADVRMDDVASTECPQSPACSTPTPLESPLGGLGAFTALPAGVMVPSGNLHIESTDVVDRIVRSMPDGIFNKCLEQELQTIDETSSCPESSVPQAVEGHDIAEFPETEIPENVSSEPDVADTPVSPSACPSCSLATNAGVAVVEAVLGKIASLEEELRLCRKELTHMRGVTIAAASATSANEVSTTTLQAELASPKLATSPISSLCLAVSQPQSLSYGTPRHELLSPTVHSQNQVSSAQPQDSPRPGASSSSSLQAVSVGTKVRVTGLVKLPDFNGLSGVVQSIDMENGRYNVMLDSPAGAHGQKWAKVKGDNLVVISAHSSLTRKGLSSSPPAQPEPRSSLAYQGLASVPPASGSPAFRDAAYRRGLQSRQSRSAVPLKLNEII